MFGLLLRVAVGVVAAGLIGAAAYTIYKKITKNAIREEAEARLRKEQLQKNEILQNALKAKIKKIEESQGTVTVDILDEWDNEVLPNVEIHGEEIDDSLRKDQEIEIGSVS